MNVSFDIDDTLYRIREECKDQVPDYDLIQVARWFYANGDNVYAWSAGGVDYTETILRRLGLDRIVTAIPKTNDAANAFDIDLTFDDQECQLGRTNILVNRHYTHRHYTP
jgi:phosphoserine phosphatase